VNLKRRKIDEAGKAAQRGRDQKKMDDLRLGRLTNTALTENTKKGRGEGKFIKKSPEKKLQGT